MFEPWNLDKDVITVNDVLLLENGMPSHKLLSSPKSNGLVANIESENAPRDFNFYLDTNEICDLFEKIENGLINSYFVALAVTVTYIKAIYNNSVLNAHDFFTEAIHRILDEAVARWSYLVAQILFEFIQKDFIRIENIHEFISKHSLCEDKFLCMFEKARIENTQTYLQKEFGKCLLETTNGYPSNKTFVAAYITTLEKDIVHCVRGIIDHFSPAIPKNFLHKGVSKLLINILHNFPFSEKELADFLSKFKSIFFVPEDSEVYPGKIIGFSLKSETEISNVLAIYINLYRAIQFYHAGKLFDQQETKENSELLEVLSPYVYASLKEFAFTSGKIHFPEKNAFLNEGFKCITPEIRLNPSEDFPLLTVQKEDFLLIENAPEVKLQNRDGFGAKKKSHKSSNQMKCGKRKVTKSKVSERLQVKVKRKNKKGCRKQEITAEATIERPLIFETSQTGGTQLQHSEEIDTIFEDTLRKRKQEKPLKRCGNCKSLDSRFNADNGLVNTVEMRPTDMAEIYINGRKIVKKPRYYSKGCKHDSILKALETCMVKQDQKKMNIEIQNNNHNFGNIDCIFGQVHGKEEIQILRKILKQLRSPNKFKKIPISMRSKTFGEQRNFRDGSNITTENGYNKKFYQIFEDTFVKSKRKRHLKRKLKNCKPLDFQFNEKSISCNEDFFDNKKSPESTLQRHLQGLLISNCTDETHDEINRNNTMLFKDENTIDIVEMCLVDTVETYTDEWKIIRKPSSSCSSNDSGYRSTIGTPMTCTVKHHQNTNIKIQKDAISNHNFENQSARFYTPTGNESLLMTANIDSSISNCNMNRMETSYYRPRTLEEKTIETPWRVNWKTTADDYRHGKCTSENYSVPNSYLSYTSDKPFHELYPWNSKSIIEVSSITRPKAFTEITSELNKREIPYENDLPFQSFYSKTEASEDTLKPFSLNLQKNLIRKINVNQSQTNDFNTCEEQSEILLLQNIEHMSLFLEKLMN